MLPFSSAVGILGVGSADLIFATVPPVMASTGPVTGGGASVAPIAATAFIPGGDGGVCVIFLCWLGHKSILLLSVPIFGMFESHSMHTYQLCGFQSHTFGS